MTFEELKEATRGYQLEVISDLRQLIDKGEIVIKRHKAGSSESNLIFRNCEIRDVNINSELSDTKITFIAKKID